MGHTLDLLPNELIEYILDYLDDFVSLLNIARVNWHLHALALGRIYSSFFGYKPVLFLRTVALPSPSGLGNVTNYVKEVSWLLGLHVPRRNRSISNKGVITSTQRRAIVQAFRDLELSNSELKGDLASHFARENYSGPDSGHWFFEFFLLFLPKVERLRVYDAWHWDDHTYWFTNVSANADRFQHLSSVTIHGPLRLENVVPLFTLPALRDLELWQVIVMRQTSDQDFAWELPGHSIKDKLSVSSHLETLALRESFIPTASLVPVLDAIRGLKSFTCDHKANNLSFPEQTTILVDYELLAKTLSRHALERLRIRDREMFFTDKVIADLISPLASLRSLSVGSLFFSYSEQAETKAKQLANVLPANLRSLELEFISAHEGDGEDEDKEDNTFKVLFVKRFAKAMQGTRLEELGVSCGKAALASSVQEALEKELAGLGMRFLTMEPMVF